MWNVNKQRINKDKFPTNKLLALKERPQKKDETLESSKSFVGHQIVEGVRSREEY